MSSVATAVVGGSLVSGYLGSKGAKDAANISAGASRDANQLQWDMYEQARQDMSPYRQVAVGDEIHGERDRYDRDMKIYNSAREKLAEAEASGNYSLQRMLRDTMPDKPKESDYDFDAVTGYTGGTLNKLANWGQSRVNSGDYIPDSAVPLLSDYANQNIGAQDEYNAINFQTDSQVPKYDVDKRDIQDFSYEGDGIPEYDYAGKPAEFNVQRDIARLDAPEFNVQGNVEKFDPSGVNVYDDPGYQFRKSEQDKAATRAMASMGKFTSGQRIDDIMQRSGQMASQEFDKARGRAVEDYQLDRGAEETQYGRDVGAYERGYRRAGDVYESDKSAYADKYSADLTAYDANRAREQEQYGRSLTGYELDRQREQGQYGRAVGEYGMQRDVGREQYQSDLTDYGMRRQYNTDVYGRDVDAYGRSIDAYNRAYGRDVDQYGRDLTAFNAATSRENTNYARGVDAYGRAYGQETDYLNRLAALSNTGQTAATNTANMGMSAAQIGGNALISAGQAQAAGIMGSANAWGNAIGDATSMYAYANRPQTQQYNPYNSDVYSPYGGSYGMYGSMQS